jgi:hypothetical protein
MNPRVVEFVNGLRAGTTDLLKVLRRPKDASLQVVPVLAAMPVLAIKRARSVPSRSRRKSSSSTRTKTRNAPKPRRKSRSKTVGLTESSKRISSLAVKPTSIVETCPSCGLQAPGTLLAEHFLGSPSHRYSPEKVALVDSTPVETDIHAKEDDSRQSVRNLLQILIPPRAFGLRHAHRLVSPLSSVVHDLGPSRARHS